ncbi:uncharacterized protein EDB93DRAFT_1253206 [Suillus bovinus]|uniref:uncharacterized protein n=1 Tax=Suillus bovinus TaxID=48563 RepID=UPI001B85E369|nr:uncharacterized protein EDB93DRAFT_1253206 [Suillus bovinus]KAG2138655.1 hypothetical protein EDB93DRAFT_1253206 [Suillus bovinus]
MPSWEMLELIRPLAWEGNIQRTNALVQYLVTHAADRRILFNEGGKKPDDEGPPSGSNKTKICAVIAQHIFETDQEYMGWYSEDPAKFTSTVTNRLNYLMNKYKRHCGRFSQTGAGIDPSQPNASNNLLEQVILEFPWYSALDNIWGHNPAYAPKTFSSTQGVNHAGDMIALMSKHKGKEKEVPPDLDDKVMETADDGLSPPAPAINTPPAPAVNAPPAPAINAPPAPAVNAPAINAPAMDAPPAAPHLNPPIDYYTLEDDHFFENLEEQQGDFEMGDQEQTGPQDRVAGKRPFSLPLPPPTPPAHLSWDLQVPCGLRDGRSRHSLTPITPIHHIIIGSIIISMHNYPHIG